MESKDYLVSCDVGQTELLVNQPQDGWVTASELKSGETVVSSAFWCAGQATKGIGFGTCTGIAYVPRKVSPSLKAIGFIANGGNSNF